MKTINDAVKVLPKKCRKPFIKLFDLCETMDLYGDNEIEAYFEVILDVLSKKIKRTNKREELLNSFFSELDNI